MFQRKRKKNNLIGVARRQIGTSVTIGGGAMGIQKMGYSTAGTTAMAGYIPMASSLAMGSYLIKEVKPKRRRKR